jgi:hypothetical protein
MYSPDFKWVLILSFSLPGTKPVENVFFAKIRGAGVYITFFPENQCQALQAKEIGFLFQVLPQNGGVLVRRHIIGQFCLLIAEKFQDILKMVRISVDEIDKTRHCFVEWKLIAPGVKRPPKRLAK